MDRFVNNDNVEVWYLIGRGLIGGLGTLTLTPSQVASHQLTLTVRVDPQP